MKERLVGKSIELTFDEDKYIGLKLGLTTRIIQIRSWIFMLTQS